MEPISIHDLNAMYSYVGHKLGGIFLNGVLITWPEWLQESAYYDIDLVIEYFLNPSSKAIHICSPELKVGLVACQFEGQRYNRH
jgi:hypothetical protein